MQASQIAKGKCAEKENKPAVASDASDCCCMVAPWEIEEQDRAYKLKVTKTKEQEVQGETKTVPDKEDPSNKEKNTYELHVITPPADGDGNVSYKKITSKHTFLKKECDLKMLVKSTTQEKSIDEGGSFEIDTDGNIKNALATCQESDPTKFDFTSIDIPVSDTHTPNVQYVDANENTSAGPITDLNAPIYQYEEPIAAESDLVVLFKALSDPSSLAKEIEIKPIGSNKCPLNPKVKLWVVTSLAIDGEVTLDYKPQHTVYEYKKQAKTALANAKLSVIGKVGIKKGTASIEYATGYATGSNADGNNTYSKVRRKNAKALFGGIHQPINDFYKLFGTNPHVKKKGALSFDAGTTQLYIKASNLELAENPNDYTLDWQGKFDLGITLFKGMHGKCDIINAIVAKGNDTISVFVETVREKAKEGYDGKYFAVSAEVEAFVKITGEVDGKCSWEKKAGTEITPSGEISGTIGLSIEAKVEGKTRVFELKARAGAEIKTTSAKDSNSPPALVASLSAKSGKDSRIDFDGDVKFTGLAIYYGFYAEATTKSDDITEDTTGGFPQNDNDAVEQITDGTKITTSGNLVLVDEFSFGKAFFGKKDTK